MADTSTRVSGPVTIEQTSREVGQPCTRRIALDPRKDLIAALEPMDRIKLVL